MNKEPLSLMQQISAFLFGFEAVQEECFMCGAKPSNNLGDGDYICDRCWSKPLDK